MKTHDSFIARDAAGKNAAECYWTEFESLSDLVDAGTPARWRRSRAGGTLEEFRAYNAHRHLPSTFGDTMPTLAATDAALRDGRTQPQTLGAYEELKNQLETDMMPSDLLGMSARRRRVWSDTDGEPDTDRVMAGRDQFMGESRRGRPMQLIRLGINITRSSGNDESGYIKAAAVCGAVADHLVRLGYPVQITGLSIVEHGNWTAHTWPVKSASEPLDIERVLSMALPGLHRWHICNGLRESGSVRAPDAETLNRFGIDYAFGKQWANDQQTDIFDGVRQVLAGSIGDTDTSRF